MTGYNLLFTTPVDWPAFYKDKKKITSKNVILSQPRLSLIAGYSSLFFFWKSNIIPIWLADVASKKKKNPQKKDGKQLPNLVAKLIDTVVNDWK